VRPALLTLLLIVGCKESIQHAPDAALGSDADPDGSANPGGIAQIAAGWEHGCVRYNDGKLKCWGSNGNGQASPPAGAFTDITMGRDTSCGLRGQTAECWSSPEPANVPTEPLKAIAAAEDDACGIALDNTLRCWGQGSVTPPTGTFKQITGGWRFLCGLRTDDTVTCWGEDYGTVGVPPPSGTFLKISAAHENVCGLRSNAMVECWGSGDENQLPPTTTETFDQIAAGELLTCLLRGDQSVVCHGVGFTTTNTGPSGKFVAIDANTDFACGIRTDGTAVCWDATSEMAIP
jgi:alpha-tubulin suppressor-like RCC1 family protein